MSFYYVDFDLGRDPAEDLPLVNRDEPAGVILGWLDALDPRLSRPPGLRLGAFAFDEPERSVIIIAVGPDGPVNPDAFLSSAPYDLDDLAGASVMSRTDARLVEEVVSSVAERANRLLTLARRLWPEPPEQTYEVGA